ncbi:MAG: hypothetical protein UV08_C0020G0015 [Parcubacteria group bacterium GW2011_GWA2_42_18]|nr:MAG: hypothetical protein UV08_C0020G0015 [Parcubacteria group bacterium GW2011_GWA2_42_18]
MLDLKKLKEAWLSGLKHRFRKPACRKASEVRILPLPKLNEVKLRRRARQLLVLRGGFEKAEYIATSPGDKVRYDAYTEPVRFESSRFRN